jgi:adenosine deaminase
MTKPIESFITQMPKVELHVHLEGSVRPETLIKLASKYQIDLPAKNLDELNAWYTFKDFEHFIEVYSTISNCFRHVDDLELITREFLIGQAEQNIRYSEVTFTPYSQYVNSGLGFHEQMDAVDKARLWAQKELGVQMAVIVAICVIYVLLGTAMEELSMILLTVPIFFPLIVALGLDPIWFGILIVCIVEIGMISPPVGMNVFVLRSVLPDVPTGAIWRGVMPFLIADILRLAVLIAFPIIALWLPRKLGL